MKGLRRTAALVIALVFAGSAAFARPAAASTITPGSCAAGTLPHGALSLLCVPRAWNGDLVVYAHGYVAPGEPLAFQHLSLPDGTSLPDLVQGLGYAFATTSYRANGLVVLEGVEDLRELIAAFGTAAPTPPRHTFVTGASEGGLVATLLAERSPELVSGALAACGPIGHFRGQIDYVGDFRVLFDYFFPGVLPGSPISIPPALRSGWSAIYAPRVVAALANDPGRAVQLLRTAHAAVDPHDTVGTSGVATVLGLLWYNVFATNDAGAKLGGNPYSNFGRWYSGSNDDLRLNIFIRRYAASPAAIAAMRAYETSARLVRPLFTLHTDNDPIVPFWHEIGYFIKSDAATRGRLLQLPVVRYGHCAFTGSELLGTFVLLALRVSSER